MDLIRSAGQVIGALAIFGVGLFILMLILTGNVVTYKVMAKNVEKVKTEITDQNVQAALTETEKNSAEAINNTAEISATISKGASNITQEAVNQVVDIISLVVLLAIVGGLALLILPHVRPYIQGVFGGRQTGPAMPPTFGPQP